MATKLGSTTISKLYLGSTEITKAYLGSTEVYNSGGVADIYAANSISPEFVADFANDYYRVASNDSTFASAFTFSRSSSATYVDSSGVIQTAASGVARVGHHVYNGTSWVNKGILVESEARTNLFPYSEDFSQSSWINIDSTESLENVTSPANDASVYRLDDGTTSNRHGIYDQLNLTSGNTYAFSCFIKDDDRQYVQLMISQFGGGISAIVYFDLVNGVVTDENTGTGYIEDFGNGWYKCTVVGTVTNNTCYCIVSLSDRATHTGTLFAGNPSYTGSNKGIYIWGAQLEEASTPSSYIPTSGSTVTRAADVLTVDAANAPYNATAMSIQVSGKQTGDSYTMTRWLADASNYITLESGTNDFTFEQANGGTVDSVTGGSFTSGINVDYNIASRNGTTFINGAVDGTALTEDTTPTALPDLSTTDVQLGYDFMGTINLFRMWDQDIGDTGIEEASS